MLKNKNKDKSGGTKPESTKIKKTGAKKPDEKRAVIMPRPLFDYDSVISERGAEVAGRAIAADGYKALLPPEGTAREHKGEKNAAAVTVKLAKAVKRAADALKRAPDGSEKYLSALAVLEENARLFAKFSVLDESPLLSLRGVTKKYGADDALNGISLDIYRGERIFVTGGEGSGKSTFLRCLNLLESPTGGDIFFCGKLVFARHSEEMLGKIKLLYEMRGAVRQSKRKQLSVLKKRLRLALRMQQSNAVAEARSFLPRRALSEIRLELDSLRLQKKQAVPPEGDSFNAQIERAEAELRCAKEYSAIMRAAAECGLTEIPEPNEINERIVALKKEGPASGRADTAAFNELIVDAWRKFKDLKSKELFSRGKLDAEITKNRLRMGMVYSRFNLFPHLSVKENLLFAPVNLGGMPERKAAERAHKMLSLAGISEIADSFPPSLTEAETRKAAISRALMTEPEILFADEPLSGLSGAEAAEIAALIDDASTDVSVTVIAVRELPEGIKPGSRVIALENGRIIHDYVV